METRRLQANARFDVGIKEAVGISLEGKCKANGWTICRVYVPENVTEAQYRMIPKTGVMMSVAVDPLAAVLVRSRLLFGLLKWWRKKKTYAALAWD